MGSTVCFQTRGSAVSPLPSERSGILSNIPRGSEVHPIHQGSSEGVSKQDTPVSRLPLSHTVEELVFNATTVYLRLLHERQNNRLLSSLDEDEEYTFSTNADNIV